MSDEQKCPKCGAASAVDPHGMRYACGSFFLREPLSVLGDDPLEAGFHQVINNCVVYELRAQLAASRAEVERLKKKLNGFGSNELAALLTEPDDHEPKA